MTNNFRYYQQEADVAIYEELLINNKCLVKMFCGTGKSKLMRYCKVAQNKKLVVYVVPSLSLLEQFYTDYLQDFDKTQIQIKIQSIFKELVNNIRYISTIIQGNMESIFGTKFKSNCDYKIEADFGWKYVPLN